MVKESDINGPCPNCGEKTLIMVDVRYSCPLQFIAVCKSCGFSAKGEGEPIKVLSGEDAVRKRPELWINDPEWGNLAKQILGGCGGEQKW